ncbi:hypothetical protein SRHO_G00003700 [Serrasalmus rhombeus]
MWGFNEGPCRTLISLGHGDPLHTWTRPSEDGHRLNVFPLRDEIWYGSCTLHSPSTLKPRQK